MPSAMLRTEGYSRTVCYLCFQMIIVFIHLKLQNFECITSCGSSNYIHSKTMSLQGGAPPVSVWGWAGLGVWLLVADIVASPCHLWNHSLKKEGFSSSIQPSQAEVHAGRGQHLPTASRCMGLAWSGQSNPKLSQIHTAHPGRHPGDRTTGWSSFLRRLQLQKLC